MFMKKYKATISVIGLGYIGFPFLLSLHKCKYNLLGIDSNLKKLKSIKNKTFKSEEMEINQLFKKIPEKRISLVTNKECFIKITSDGEQRGIFKNVGSEETIKILPKTGGARTVLLSPKNQ